jgi:VanZ family protein
VRRLPFAVAVMVSVVVLFSPASGVPAAPPGVDKVVHLGLFALLAVTGGVAGLPGLWLAVGLAGYAVASEVLQAELPIGRSGDVLDVLVDGVGISVGLLLVAGVRALRRERRPAQPDRRPRPRG